MQTKSALGCRFDAVAVGEVMLRLDPGHKRIHTTRSFDVWEGGGEYNVVRALRRTFGLRTAHVTALVDNPVGRLVEDLMLQGGVDTTILRWAESDAAGRQRRNGLNFVERGFGVRAGVSCSDRGNTAVSQLGSGDIDWEAVFGEPGVRLFHTGGVFAGLSDSTPAVAREAMAAAHATGTRVSFDLNYRASLWAGRGGVEAAREVNRALLPLVDVLFGNVAAFDEALGVPWDPDLAPPTAFQRSVAAITTQYPSVRTVVSTSRVCDSASHEQLGALCYHEGQFFEVDPRPVEIFDRVGAGDALAAGFLFGLLGGRVPVWSLRCGFAHAALAMTTPGDNAMVTLPEVVGVMEGQGVWMSR